MESLEKQILTLSQKVEAIYQVIERLDMRLSEALSGSSLEKLPVRENYLETKQTQVYDLTEQININAVLEHKDILMDGIVYPEINYQVRDRQITPEIQIQRLTTQLTAAYHRIAALEEQLLRQRVN
jgi:chaperonin cofactor prefoldin